MEKYRLCLHKRDIFYKKITLFSVQVLYNPKKCSIFALDLLTNIFFYYSKYELFYYFIG